MTNATTMKSIFGSPIFMQSTLVIWIMKAVWVLFFIMLDWTKSNGWNCCFMYMHWYYYFFKKKNQFQYLENWFWIKCFLPFVLNHVNVGLHVSCLLLFCWIYKNQWLKLLYHVSLLMFLKFFDQSISLPLKRLMVPIFWSHVTL